MINHTSSQIKWLFAPLEKLTEDYLPQIKLLDKRERWKRVAKILKVSKKAQPRLEWIIYYYDGYSAAETARRFGITRKTFYKWYREFDEDNLYSLRRLEDKSRAPLRVRQREITPVQEQRIIALRKQYIRYSSKKLVRYYKEKYGEDISAWKIQKVIEARKLYFNPIKTAKIQRKRQRAQKKKRITELELYRLPWYKNKAGYIICLDTIVIYWNGLKRYIFTAIDKYGKFAFARMYKSKSSLNARDFLFRLNYLLDGQIPRVGHDNGSEFGKLFAAACQELKIEQYWNRIKTPRDNPNNERFNQTLQNEFLALGNFHSDPAIFNQRLTEWLIEYTFRRPHQALGYKTPIEFSKVLPMYSRSTIPCFFVNLMLI